MCTVLSGNVSEFFFEAATGAEIAHLNSIKRAKPRQFTTPVQRVWNYSRGEQLDARFTLQLKSCDDARWNNSSRMILLMGQRWWKRELTNAPQLP